MTGSYLVIFHRFLLLIFSGHLIPVMFLRPLLMKTCIVLVEAIVDLHVSDPYRRTDFTLQLKILIFAAVLLALLLQIGLRIAKASADMVKWNSLFSKTLSIWLNVNLMIVWKMHFRLVFDFSVPCQKYINVLSNIGKQYKKGYIRHIFWDRHFFTTITLK